jgi:hypothetical protein
MATAVSRSSSTSRSSGPPRVSATGPDPVRIRTGKFAAAAPAATDAAASTASSKSSGSAHDPGRASSTTVVVGRLASTRRRTMSVPVRADDFQWMCRISSPITYSRSAWKVAVPAGDRSLVGPSRWCARPDGSSPSGTVLGRTSSVCGDPYSRTRRARRNGSARTSRSGPTGISPRRSVGSR